MSQILPRQRFYRRICRWWSRLPKRLRVSDGVLGSFLLLAWMALIASWVFPHRFNFSANLTVRSLSFTYDGDRDRDFLGTIPSLTTVRLTGVVTNPIVLRGTFAIAAADADTARAIAPLNQRLSQESSLTITLDAPDSSFSLSAIDPQTGAIALQGLTIHPSTRIDNLQYSPPVRELSFILCQLDPAAFNCNALTAPDDPSPPSEPNLLDLQTGAQPLRLRLENTAIAEIDRLDPSLRDRLTPNAIALTFTPTPTFAAETITFELSDRAVIVATVPDPTTAIDPTTGDPQPWFFQDIPTRAVRFQRYTDTADVADSITESTILTGTVSGPGDKPLTLERSQYLIFDDGDRPHIDRIRSIDIRRSPPIGLQLLAGGQATELGVGLYPDAPLVTQSEPFLASFMGDAQINALIGFISALSALFLPKLFDDDDDDDDESAN